MSQSNPCLHVAGYNSFDEAIHRIILDKYNLIFLTAKSTIGKSYFSRKLHSLGFIIVELDTIVEAIMNRYHLDRSKAFGIYGGFAPKPYIDEFIEIVVNCIRQCHQDRTKLVIEGAIKNADIIKRIFAGQRYLFCFLIATNQKHQYQRSIQRMIEDLETNKHTVPVTYSVEILNDYVQHREKSPLFQHLVSHFVTETIHENLTRCQYFIDSDLDIYLIDVDKN